MAVRTRSSSGPLAVVTGALATLVLPIGIAASWVSEPVELLHAAFAIPLAAGLGIAAILLSRRGRTQVRTLRLSGSAEVAAGRALGLLGLCLAITATISVGFYAVLVLFQ